MSRHKSRGWRGQYDRVKRWHRLVQEIGKQRTTATDTEQQHDFLYAFFQNCCHLREWLENSGAIGVQPLQEFFREHPPMQLCRDICNGTKHWDIDRPSIDAHFKIGREYVPSSQSGDRPQINETWFIVSAGLRYDLFELADSCVHLWDAFLKDNGLLR